MAQLALPRASVYYKMNQIVANQIKKAYDESPCSWSLEECLGVFEYYFRKYREIMYPFSHPHMSTRAIHRIISRLDSVEDAFGREYYLEPGDYPEIIDAYFAEDFQDTYRGCDCSMAHFMSGDIRLNRCFDLGTVL